MTSDDAVPYAEEVYRDKHRAAPRHARRSGERAPGQRYMDDAQADEGRYADTGRYADGDAVYDDPYDDAVYDDGPYGAGRSGRHRAPSGGGRRDRRTGRRRPVLTTLAVLLLVAVLVVVGVGVHLDHEINPGGRPGRLVSVTIPQGSSTAQIGGDLARAGVISGPSLFRYYVGLRHAGPLLPGTYQLATHESYGSVVASLEKGPVVVVEHLVVPEGFTLHQIAARVQALPGLGLSAAKFEAASSTGAVRSTYEPAGVDDLEGMLFPATYDITKGMTETDVAQMMVSTFDSHAAALGLPAAATALSMTPYAVITVASIVEREAKVDADRGGVASALYNRLRVGMTLGADSTLVYALRQTDPGLDVNSVDYNQANPYNTRRNKGLPPTPIANPGLPSLTAAIQPPTTTNLYFVEINPDGQLGFASSTSGFDTLTQECRAAHLC